MNDDCLHVQELMKWVKRFKSLPDSEILSPFEVADVLTPAAIGICSNDMVKSNVQVLKQFKTEKDLMNTNTVLMPCDDPKHAHAQPCYCKCRQYRNRAHILFTCDICNEVPIGCLYACAECDDIVHTLCEKCFTLYEHGCGSRMEVFTEPLAYQSAKMNQCGGRGHPPTFEDSPLEKQIKRWRSCKKVRDPINTKKTMNAPLHSIPK